MAETITIEGSRSPSVELATGVRRTVRRTERIDRLIARGFVTVVDEPAVSDEAPKPAVAAAEPEPEPEVAPARGRRTAAAKDSDGPATAE